MALEEVKFLRDFTGDPDRLFERKAFIALKRTIIEVEGVDFFNSINRPILLSSQPLEGGNQVGDMSVFFILPSVGGSGGTFYHYLAVVHKELEQYSLGLRVETSERWKVYRESFQGKHDAITIQDGPHITYAFKYSKAFGGYVLG